MVCSGTRRKVMADQKTADRLKSDCLPAKKVLTEADFNALIDAADIGRKAVAQSPNQTDDQMGAVSGLAVEPAGQLALQLAEAGGALRLEAGAVYVRCGVGMVQADESGLELELARDGGLTFNRHGEVAVLLAQGGGLKFDEKRALAVDADEGGLAIVDGHVVVCRGSGIKPDTRNPQITSGTV